MNMKKSIADWIKKISKNTNSNLLNKKIIKYIDILNKIDKERIEHKNIIAKLFNDEKSARKENQDKIYLNLNNHYILKPQNDILKDLYISTIQELFKDINDKNSQLNKLQCQLSSFKAIFLTKLNSTLNADTNPNVIDELDSLLKIKETFLKTEKLLELMESMDQFVHLNSITNVHSANTKTDIINDNDLKEITREMQANHEKITNSLTINQIIFGKYRQKLISLIKESNDKEKQETIKTLNYNITRLKDIYVDLGLFSKKKLDVLKNFPLSNTFKNIHDHFYLINKADTETLYILCPVRCAIDSLNNTLIYHESFNIIHDINKWVDKELSNLDQSKILTDKLNLHRSLYVSSLNLKLDKLNLHVRNKIEKNENLITKMLKFWIEKEFTQFCQRNQISERKQD
ncbi:unnamed protein product [Gordionus sp. m RMFG-2023]